MSMHPSRNLIIRKSIHFFTGMVILALTWLVERDMLLWLIIGGTMFSFVTFRYRRFYLLHKTSYASLGTLFYPLGILSACLLLYHKPVDYFRISLLVLTVSDTIANIIGQIKNGNGRFRVLRDTKSMHGIAGFVIATLVILFVLLPIEAFTDPFYIFYILLIAVAMEVISWRGSDNVSIPFGLAVFFYFSAGSEVDYGYLSMVMLIISIGSIMMYRWGVLTIGGSLAAWVLGNYLLIIPGFLWIVPVLVFFFSSVVLTKVRNTRSRKAGGAGGRNAWQVTANILWAVVSSALSLITHEILFIYLYIVFVAAVTADTWASEAGPLINRRSFSLGDGKWHPAGVTGGISLGGTLAALAGAWLISALSWWLFFGGWDFYRISILALAAFAGCFADTLLGAFVEGKMLKMPFFRQRNHSEKITPNDIVNLGGSLAAGLIAWGLLTV